MLATPRNEFPEFPAALSFIFGLSAEEARAALERRADALRASLADLDRDLESGPPRLFLLETEYVRRVTAAEIEWVEAVVDDLKAGRLAWSKDDMARWAEIARDFTPPDPA